jgi:uncharacterized repeat protein (TIGR04042 family)
MPEMHFTVRWPDGSTQRCYSPSLVIKDYFEPGRDYPLDDFVRQSGEALDIATERVRVKYGFGCGHAIAQKAAIEARAAQMPESPDARVRVESFEE